MTNDHLSLVIDHSALAAVHFPRRRSGRHRHGQVLPHPVRDHRKARRAGLIGLEQHRPRHAVLRDPNDAEDARVGHGSAQTEKGRGVRESVLRGDAQQHDRIGTNGEMSRHARLPPHHPHPRGGAGPAGERDPATRNSRIESGRTAKCPATLVCPHITTSCAAGPAATLNATCRSTAPTDAMTVADPTRSPSVTPARAWPSASVAAVGGVTRALIPVNETVWRASTAPVESRTSKTTGRGSWLPAVPRWPPPETNADRVADATTAGGAGGGGGCRGATGAGGGVVRTGVARAIGGAPRVALLPLAVRRAQSSTAASMAGSAPMTLRSFLSRAVGSNVRQLRRTSCASSPDDMSAPDTSRPRSLLRTGAPPLPGSASVASNMPTRLMAAGTPSCRIGARPSRRTPTAPDRAPRAADRTMPSALSVRSAARGARSG